MELWKEALKDYKKESILAPLFKMLEALLDLLVPLVMAKIINVGIASGDKGYIISRSILLIVLGAAGLAISITAQYFAAKAATGASTKLRHDLFEHIGELGYGELDKIGTGTLVTRMTSDINQVQNGINLALRLLLRSPFIVFGSMIMAFTINVRAALIFVVTIPLLAVVIFGIMKKTRPLYKKVQDSLDTVTGLTHDNLTGVRVVRAFGREDAEVEEFDAADEALTRGQLHVGRLSALMNPLTLIIINLAVAAILYRGGIEVNTGTLAAGDVIALINYMNQILIELVKLANLIVTISRSLACADRVGDIMKMQPAMIYGTEKVAAEENDHVPFAVEFDHVSLAYGGSAEESLSDISFRVKPSQTVGIIGGTGSGKTSLVNLIPRYYDATKGTVRLYGHDVKDYDRESLRGCVGMVAQKAQLFSGTIRSNLAWGNEHADDAAMWRALDAAQASEFVKKKEKDLDEPVEQSGRNFSGGQKQRLTIARALVRDPAVLILDDSASALDFATDAALRRAIRDLSGTMTTFIVSQRTNSIMGADLILVLDDGRLVGAGTHRELMASCPVYQDIYYSQYEKGEDAS
ncbi:MAG: ABC transporter ATP-binding protein [Lachnospiraceae bacterium]|nr:ABC transporter ATP-binding protein [Lachnospiraceae bacterium]